MSKRIHIFVAPEVDDARLDPYAFRILHRIRRRQGSGWCSESVKSMAEACRMNEKSARAAIDDLLERRFIEKVERFGKTWLYRVTDSGLWALTPAKNGGGTPTENGRGKADSQKDANQDQPLPKTAGVPLPDLTPAKNGGGPNTAGVPLPNQADEERNSKKETITTTTTRARGDEPSAELTFDSDPLADLGFLAGIDDRHEQSVRDVLGILANSTFSDAGEAYIALKAATYGHRGMALAPVHNSVMLAFHRAHGWTRLVAACTIGARRSIHLDSIESIAQIWDKPKHTNGWNARANVQAASSANEGTGERNLRGGARQNGGVRASGVQRTGGMSIREQLLQSGRSPEQVERILSGDLTAFSAGYPDRDPDQVALIAAGAPGDDRGGDRAPAGDVRNGSARGSGEADGAGDSECRVDDRRASSL